jgi:predicted metal-dependent RNase
LHETHPELFEKAVRYELEHADGRRYFWSEDESLLELIARKDRIIEDHNRAMSQKKKVLRNRPLIDVLESVLDDENEDLCFVCNL